MQQQLLQQFHWLEKVVTRVSRAPRMDRAIGRAIIKISIGTTTTTYIWLRIRQSVLATLMPALMAVYLGENVMKVSSC